MQLLKRLRDAIEPQPNQSASKIDPAYAYDLLANERRRRIIEFLVEFEPGTIVDVRDIADAISQGDRNACYVSLIQSHLTKFDNSEDDNRNCLLEYDERAKTVKIRPELHAVYRAHEAFANELD
ncbi:hypothetical protein ACFQMM_02675 [Saliphagus sp. GCM10025308]